MIFSPYGTRRDSAGSTQRHHEANLISDKLLFDVVTLECLQGYIRHVRLDVLPDVDHNIPSLDRISNHLIRPQRPYLETGRFDEPTLSPDCNPVLQDINVGHY
jgi:hypothetical protein